MSISEVGNVITLDNTGDLAVTNEGSLTVAAGTSTTSVINSNTSGSTGVTLTAGTGLAISETGNTITLDNTGDLSATNELQTYSHSGTTSYTNTLSNSGGSFTLQSGTGITLSHTAGTTTITNSGDLSTTNEGSLTVGAGSGTTSVISSNTSGSTDVTLTAGTGLSISEVGNVITLANTGDLSATNELQTYSHSGTTSYTNTLSNSGGSFTLQAGTGITLSHTAGTTTISTSGGAALTAADNGLSVVGSTVKLGGPLTQAGTSIEMGTNEVLRFYGDGKWSVSSWTGFGIDPNNSKAGFSGIEGSPTLNATPTIDAIVELNPNNSAGTIQSNSLAFGGYSTDADGFWIQSRSNAVPNFEYPLTMQPRGGQFAVGRLNGLDALVTLSGIGLAGSTVAGSVLHLENNEGNGKAAMSMGVGTDQMDSEVAWFDATDALRITNRSSVNNSSSVRVAIGGETNDLATFVKSSNATSLAKFGVGIGNPTNIHSTIQSAGGYAGRVLTTVGSFTLDESNWNVIYTGSGTVTWTLPDPTTCSGREYILCSRGTGTVNIGTYTVSKGNGGNFNSLSAGQWAIIWSDGSGWTGFKLASL